MKIALVQGGLGQEAEVSRSTGKSFEKALKDLGHNYVVIDADDKLMSKLEAESPDKILLALHGKYAEDGTVQGICEYLKIPYTGSGILASALAMDKLRTKEVLSFYNILTPKFQIFKRGIDSISNFPNEVGYPCVVKPVREGSSVGISIVQKAEEYSEALELACKYDRNILVEEFVTGPECTVPVVGGKGLTPIEIRPKSGFYNYESKYTKGKTEYLLPPELPEVVVSELKKQAVKIFEILDLHYYSRIDFIVKDNKEAYFIEANTLPGCTETSLLPQSAAYDGISFSALVQGLLDNARLDYEGMV